MPRPPKRERAVRAEIIENTAARHAQPFVPRGFQLYMLPGPAASKAPAMCSIAGVCVPAGQVTATTIEAGRVIEQFMPPQIREGHAREAPLLVAIDGFGRMPCFLRGPRLHFDENDRATVHGHDIELAQHGSIVTSHDLVTSLFQVARGGLFAAIAQGLQRPKS